MCAYVKHLVCDDGEIYKQIISTYQGEESVIRGKWQAMPDLKAAVITVLVKQKRSVANRVATCRCVSVYGCIRNVK